MKRMILCAVLAIGISTLSSAQSGKPSTVKKNSSPATKANSDTVNQPALDNRKEYQWKDGQKATPTGHEATPSNTVEYSTVHKDSATQKEVTPATKKRTPGKKD